MEQAPVPVSVPEPLGWKRRTILFFISQAITLFGSSIVQFAIVWHVTLTTSSGAWVSALTVCSFLPLMLISLVSGVWADRFPRKRLIILSDGAIALATLALLFLLPALAEGLPTLIALLAVSALRSLGTGVQVPAVNALLPQLVPEQHLMRMNGINATVQSVVQFAAPAAAGAILTFGTLRSTLCIDIATAAAGIGLLCLIAVPRPVPDAAEAETEADGARGRWRDGLRYVRTDRFLTRLLLLYGLFIFLCVPAGFLATLYVSRTYGDGYAYLTAVELIGFLGMAAGGFLMSIWGGFRNRVLTLLLGLAAFGALAVGMGLAESFPLYLAFMAIYGIALTMVQTSSTTLLQENVAPAMMGRAFGFFNVIYCAALPVGMAVFGPLADVVSFRQLMAGSGLLLLVLAGVYSLFPEFIRRGIPAKPAADGNGKDA